MRRIAVGAGLGLAVLVACTGHEAAKDGQPSAADAAKAVGGFLGGIAKMAAKQDSMDKANPYHELHDPCILVSRAEVEKYIGPLRADPWREGDNCHYDAASGRSIVVDVSYTGGQAAMRMMNAVGGLTSRVLVDGSDQADTLDGVWDQVRWQLGTLDALKGDVMVGVDVQATDLGPAAAASLANTALKRLDSPLHYDGEAAADHKPGPLVTSRDPCSLVTKDEAAAILGPLTGDPKADKGGCTFTVASPLGQGTMPVLLEVEWQGGFSKFGEEKMASAMASKSFIAPTMAEATQQEAKMQKDSAGRAEIERMRQTMQSMGGPAMKDGSLQFKNDTAVAGGPWDEAAVLNGLTFAAVKKDVYMGMALQLLGEGKAKALISKAMSRI